MQKKIFLSVIAVMALISLSTNISYAQESEMSLLINTDIDIEQALIILGIGVAGALMTSFEGWHRSGQPFAKAKFFIAVKRTAKISVPAAFAMMIAFPEPTVMSYLIIGVAIILGAKMMSTKPKLLNPKFGGVDIAVNKDDTFPSPPLTVIPKLGPVGAKYQTNLVKNQAGNALSFGEHLWVKRVGVRSFVTAVLKDATGKVIQVDQSHIKDEDGDIETTRLEMYGTNKLPLPRGKYSVESRGDAGTSDTTGHIDEFSII